MTKILLTFAIPAWAILAKESFLDFIIPLLPIYLLFCVLVLVDLRLGIHAARKRGETIRRSRALRRTMAKFTDYCSIVTACKMFDTFIIREYSIPMVFITFCLLMAWVEIDSIFYNFGELRGIHLLKIIKQLIYDKLKIKLPSKQRKNENK